jgi:hypothetical protein
LPSASTNLDRLLGLRMTDCPVSALDFSLLNMQHDICDEILQILALRLYFGRDEDKLHQTVNLGTECIRLHYNLLSLSESCTICVMSAVVARMMSLMLHPDKRQRWLMSNSFFSWAGTEEGHRVFVPPFFVAIQVFWLVVGLSQV